jgi:hypothetical protein
VLAEGGSPNGCPLNGPNPGRPSQSLTLTLRSIEGRSVASVAELKPGHSRNRDLPQGIRECRRQLAQAVGGRRRRAARSAAREPPAATVDARSSIPFFELGAERTAWAIPERLRARPLGFDVYGVLKGAGLSALAPPERRPRNSSAMRQKLGTLIHPRCREARSGFVRRRETLRPRAQRDGARRGRRQRSGLDSLHVVSMTTTGTPTSNPAVKQPGTTGARLFTRPMGAFWSVGIRPVAEAQLC